MKSCFPTLKILFIVCTCLALHNFASTDEKIDFFNLFHVDPETKKKLPIPPLFIVFPESLCEISVTKFLEGDFRKKEELLAHLKNACPSYQEQEPKLIFLNFLEKIREIQFKEAFEVFRKAGNMSFTELEQFCFEINMAVFQYFMGFGTHSIQNLEMILNQNIGNENVAVHKNLISILIREGQFARADSLVEIVLENSPKNQWAQEYKIDLLKMFGTTSDLDNYLEEKATTNDSLFVFQIAYGGLLKEKKQNKLAIKYFTRGLEGYPGNGEAWLELADLFLDNPDLMENEKRNLTLKYMDKAIEAGINNPLYFNLLTKIIRRKITENLNLIKSKWEEREICVKTRRPGYCRQLYDDQIRLIESGEYSNMIRNLEVFIPQAPHVRGIFQTLHVLYGLLGDTRRASRLKNFYNFHFMAPFPNKKVPHLWVTEKQFFPYPKLKIFSGTLTTTLIFQGLMSDWFPMPYE